MVTALAARLPHRSIAEPRRDAAKVVYFIASHVHPPQVKRLVRACCSGGPQSRVLIHHDQRVSELDTARLADFGNVDVLPAQTVDWGGFTQCQLVLRAMRWLLENRDFDWLVYLSGQDYPIQPLHRIENMLGTATVDAYLDAKPVDKCNWVTGGQRYLYNYYTPPKINGVAHLMKWLRRRNEATLEAGGIPRLLVPSTRSGAGQIGVQPAFGPFRKGFRCFFGSSWWTANRRSVERVIDYDRVHPELTRHYRRVLFAPNESFFLTILLNDPTLNCTDSDAKRFISWSHPETGHPDLLRSTDFERLITSGDHFARKIDGRVDPLLLDMLDEYLGIKH